MQKFKVFLLLFIGLIFAGCIFSNVDSTPSAQSTECPAFFGVAELKERKLRISDEKALPETFTIDLKACMYPKGFVTQKLPDQYWRISLKDPKNKSSKELADFSNKLNKNEIEQHQYFESENILDSSNSGDESYQEKCKQQCYKKCQQEDEKKENCQKCEQQCPKEHPQIIYLNAEEDGCVQWSEIYDYPYVKKSQWVVIDRYISGRGNYSGTCKIPVAVNPWLQNKEDYQHIQVVDYREDYGGKHKDIAENLVMIKKCDKDKKKGKEPKCFSADEIMYSPEEEHKKNTYKIAKDCQLEDEDCFIADGLGFLDYVKRKEKNKVDLVVNKIHFHNSDSESNDSKMNLKGKINAELQYRIIDTKKELQFNSITQGDFKIIAHLFSRSKVEEDDQIKRPYRRINNGTLETPIAARFEDGILISDSVYWTIPFKFDQGSLFLYLKIIPQQETAKRINPFEGIYNLDTKYKNFFDKSDITASVDELREEYEKAFLDETYTEVAQEPKSSLDLCLKGWDFSSSLLELPCVESAYKMDRSTPGNAYTGWKVDEMKLRFEQMKKENWLFREIKTQIETRILDGIGKSDTVNNMPITIEVIDLSTGQSNLDTVKSNLDTVKVDLDTVRTDDNGSLKFSVSTRQNWYKKQRYFLKLIRFTNATKDIKEEKMVAINPWDYGFTHGFEVGLAKDDERRVLCTAQTESEKNKIDALVQQFDKDNSISLNEDQRDVVERIFCYNQGYVPTDDTSNGTLSLKKLVEYVNIFIGMLNRTKTNEKEDLFAIFKNKFKSVEHEDVINPVSYVHLFRAVNPYPTYLIDHSLGRSVYYNTRIKISPRVVRYDNIARGQMDKGPLRDGVYILRLMMVKNDQGRFNGRGAMARVLSTPFLVSKFSDSKGIVAGTKSLYSCDIPDDKIDDDKKCITLEDFIMPPTNVPVVVRDGVVKTDVPIYINRNNLLFANSKNILVFQLQPADPKSIICKDNKGFCLSDGLISKKNNGRWEDIIDWEANLQSNSIIPAKKEDYDLYFHTYQTPIIPSEWTNWTITHEMNQDFNKLSKNHSILHFKKGLNSLMDYFNRQLSTDSTKDKTWTKFLSTDRMVNLNKSINELLRENNLEEKDIKDLHQNIVESYKEKLMNQQESVKYQLAESDLTDERRAEIQKQQKHLSATIEQIDELLSEIENDYISDSRVKQQIDQLLIGGRGKKSIADLEKHKQYLNFSEEDKQKEIARLEAQKKADIQKINNSELSLEDKKRERRLVKTQAEADKEQIEAYFALSEDKKQIERDNINEQINAIEENPLNASLFLTAQPVFGEADSLSEKKDITQNDSQNTEGIIKKGLPYACVGVGDNDKGKYDYRMNGCALQSRRPSVTNTANINDDTENEDIDMSYEHIEKFATQHGLCTIGINSSLPLPKQCGSSSTHFGGEGDVWNYPLPQQFIKDLNHQIDIINKFKDQNPKISLMSEVAISTKGAMFLDVTNYWNTKEKLYKMPKLTKLTETSIANIMKGANLPENAKMDINNNETSSFLHGLCGFWFKDFISQKYNSLSLLEDALRQVVKESLHYQTRVFSSPLSKIKGENPSGNEPETTYGDHTENESDPTYGDHTENESDPTFANHTVEELQKILGKDKVNGVVKDVEDQLQNSKEEKSATGPIDYFHRWADGEENTTKQLADSLKSLLEKPPIGSNNHSPLLDFSAEHYLEQIKSWNFGVVDLKAQKHPFLKCIANPTHFFGLEKKVIVGKVGEGVAYDREGGHITRLDVTESFLMNTQRDQGSNQGFSYGLGTGELSLMSTAALLFFASDKGGNTILGRFGKWLHRHPYILLGATLFSIAGFKASMGYDWRVYEGTGKRRWFSIGVVEGTELVSEYTPIDIPLEKYHECLVIRPRFNAFELHTDKYEHIWNTESKAIRALYSKTGLMLCAEGDDKNYTIKEDYYYIQPAYAVNSPNRIIQDPRSHRNKPFAISLRGREAYHRFKDSISCALAETSQPVEDHKDNIDNAKCRDTRGEYEHLFSKHIEFAHNLREGFEVPKLFHRTGDFPGIYTPYVPPKDRDIKANLSLYHRFINWMASFVDMDLEKIIQKEPEQE